MNANPTVNSFPALAAHLLGILLVAAAVAFALGVRLPLITSYRAAFIVLLVAGLISCTIGGIGQVSAANAWAHPISIVGFVLGALLLVVGAAYLLGRPLPLISGDRAYLFAFTGILLAKIILTQLHPLLR